MMKRMPSSYGRGLAVAVFVFVLTVSPYAHAADTSAFGINDPFIDAIQLWATILTSIDALSHQLAAALQPQPSLTFSRSANSRAPKTPASRSLSAAAAVATELPPEAASRLTNVP